jgi:hypothetical protein
LGFLDEKEPSTFGGEKIVADGPIQRGEL